MQLFRLFRDLGSNLQAGAAGADQTDGHSGKIHAFHWPLGRMDYPALVVFNAGNIGHAGRGERAGREDDMARGRARSVRQRHGPRMRVVVPNRALDARVELDITAQVELVGDEFRICENFRLRRKPFGPSPLPTQFVRPRILILEALHVTTQARIAVVPPCPADLGRGIHDAYVKSQVPQAMQQVHPGKSGADDQDIERIARG